MAYIRVDNGDVAAEMLIRDATRNRFYGSIEFKFEAGNIVLVRKTETLKPQTYRENRGAEDDEMNGGSHQRN